MRAPQRRSNGLEFSAHRVALELGFAACVAVVGCIPTAHVVHRSAGGDVHTIRCNYVGRPEASCFVDADRHCPTGYRVIRNDQRGAAGMITLVVRCS